jgi:hypothetical protein
VSRRALVLFVLAVAAAVLLVACGMTPEQRADALASIAAMEARGVMTADEATAMRRAIEANAAVELDWLAQLVTAVIGALTGWGAVRLQRGPAATPPERVQRRNYRKRG